MDFEIIYQTFVSLLCNTFLDKLFTEEAEKQFASYDFIEYRTNITEDQILQEFFILHELNKANHLRECAEAGFMYTGNSNGEFLSMSQTSAMLEAQGYEKITDPANIQEVLDMVQ